MKAILEFDLPADRTEHLQAIHAGALFGAAWEVDQDLRNFLKHTTPSLESAIKAIEEARIHLGEALDLISSD